MEKIDCDFSPAAITRIPGALVLVLRQEQPLRGGAAFHSACGLFFAALHWFAMLACGLQMAFHYTPVKLVGAANRFIAAVFLVQHSAVRAQQEGTTHGDCCRESIYNARDLIHAPQAPRAIL